MIVTIRPSRAAGTIAVPPSKSMAHRALLAGALSQGSTVAGIGACEDVQATLACLRMLGASVSRQGDTVHIGGLNPFTARPDGVLDCGESGSTLRFLLPLCMLSNEECTFSGSKRLLERPLSVYENLCKRQGIRFAKEDTRLTVGGVLHGGFFSVPGNISSQFVTGLLLALPLLPEDSCIEVTGSFESASYVTMTIEVLSRFGVTVRRQENTFVIPGRQRYVHTAYVVEGDFSLGAIMAAFNLLDGNVKLDNLTADTAQGDRAYVRFFREYAQGIREFDVSDCPDLAPLLLALLALKDGGRLIGTGRLKYKESDRGAAMAAELAKCGIRTDIQENAIAVRAAGLSTPAEPLWGHNDHRIVMALSLVCSVVGGTILGAEAVAKSYPGFFEDLRRLQIALQIED